MNAIVIQADPKSNKILAELAKKLGGNVLAIDEGQYKDISLGALMDNEKTCKVVSRKDILKKLNGK
jgi:hypothetical protein